MCELNVGFLMMWCVCLMFDVCEGLSEIIDVVWLLWCDGNVCVWVLGVRFCVKLCCGFGGWMCVGV